MLKKTLRLTLFSLTVAASALEGKIADCRKYMR